MEDTGLLANSIFGGIGLMAVIVSARSGNRKVQIIGWALMLSWFVPGVYEWIVGLILTLCLYLFRKKSDSLL